MDTSRMLKEMCQEVLSTTDIKAICNARNFSSILSPAHLETIFLSARGVESAMALLNQQEIALMHLLKFQDQTVDISFFNNLYGKKTTSQKYYYITFTERYKDVLKKVKASLVRRGLILITSPEDWRVKTKMERYRFKFPKEFETYLPPLFSETKIFKGMGNFKEDVLRPHFVDLLKDNTQQALSDTLKYQLELSGGELRLGKREFQAKYCQEWLETEWKSSVQKKDKDVGKRSGLLKFIIYVFSQLKPKEWVSSEEISNIIAVFPDYSENFDIRDFCESGWKWGCLTKHKVVGTTYYRFPEKTDKCSKEPECGLTFGREDSVLVDLHTIPYESLETLRNKIKITSPYPPSRRRCSIVPLT